MSQNLDMFSDWKPRGSTIVLERDLERLSAQMRRVHAVMSDHKKRSLEQLGKDAKCPPASASARFRDLKALGFPVEKKHVSGGLWLYFMN